MAPPYAPAAATPTSTTTCATASLVSASASAAVDPLEAGHALRRALGGPARLLLGEEAPPRLGLGVAGHVVEAHALQGHLDALRELLGEGEIGGAGGAIRHLPGRERERREDAARRRGWARSSRSGSRLAQGGDVIRVGQRVAGEVGRSRPWPPWSTSWSGDGGVPGSGRVRLRRASRAASSALAGSACATTRA